MSKILSFAYKWCGPKWPITNNRVPTLVDINHAMNDGDIDDDVQAPVVFQSFKNREIIKINKERELKEKLFKQTVEQLKQTFEKTDLDKLQNLYFDFEEDDETNLEINEQDGHEPEDAELAGE